MYNARVNEDFKPHRIEEGLWLGRAPLTPEEFSLLHDIGVQDIVTLQTEDEARLGGILPPVATRIVAALGMSLYRMEITDLSAPALKARTPLAAGLVSHLRSRGRCIYVHCAAGMSRSPTVVSAYLVLSQGLSADAACNLVVTLHPSMPDRQAVRSMLPPRADPS